MTTGHVSQISLNTAKTFEDLQSGFIFRVVGDGKFEPAISDCFQSPDFLDRGDDRRLRKFLSDHARLTAEALPAPETRAQLQQSLTRCLGKGWEIGHYDSWGGNGIHSLELTLNEPGVGAQSLYVENQGEGGVLRLNTTCRKGDWTISQSLLGDVKGNITSEEAYFTH